MFSTTSRNFGRAPQHGRKPSGPPGGRETLRRGGAPRPAVDDRLTGIRAGNATAISRPALIERMEATASSGVYQWEVRRRTRLAEELERTRREIAARRVRIPAPPTWPGGASASCPPPAAWSCRGCGCRPSGSPIGPDGPGLDPNFRNGVLSAGSSGRARHRIRLCLSDPDRAPGTVRPPRRSGPGHP